MLIRRHSDIPAFIRSLHASVPVRLHATLLLFVSAFLGWLLSWLLLHAGATSLVARLPLVVLATYGIFLLLVRCWLAWIGLRRFGETHLDGVDGVGSNLPTSGGSVSTPDPIAPFHAGGGSFDGGGASASFDGPASSTSAAVEVKTRAAGAGLEAKANAMAAGLEAKSQATAGGLELLGGAGEALPVALFVIVGAALVFLIGFIFTGTPGVLVDVAVEVATAAGLIRTVARRRETYWLSSLCERTVWKALALVVLAFILALCAAAIDPTAQTLGQAISHSHR